MHHADLLQKKRVGVKSRARKRKQSGVTVSQEIGGIRWSLSEGVLPRFVHYETPNDGVPPVGMTARRRALKILGPFIVVQA